MAKEREAKESEKPEAKKPLPRWLIVALLVICAAVTAAAMSMTGLRGPSVAWDRANRTIETVWSGDPNAGDITAKLSTQPTAMPVAAMPTVPVIVAGAPLIHADRGACTNCHGVVSQQNTAVPSITALATMPHEYRGMCTNCHQITVAPDVTPVAAAGNFRAPQQPSPATGIELGAPAPKTARAPTEAEWQGLEVGPGPANFGVVVNGAEGTARTTGLRAGDVVTSINGVSIRTMNDFVSVTDRGGLAQGAIIVRREGQRLAFELRNAPRNNTAPQAASPWGTMVASPKPSEAQF